ncbi:unnamed protein product [Paramecium primaurelia]|uniref:Uncharacterized protein n=1 Tax=Paramecium primaurelia TaxID=5886 RepID=A0A8S1K3A5_PARPR|nr:unnamed protein product [Paramecium primaurelia]
MNNCFIVRKLASDDQVQIDSKKEFFLNIPLSSIKFNSLFSNNTISYYGVFKENNIIVLGWTFREQKFNRGGLYCCKIQFKILDISIKKQEIISQIQNLIYEMIDSLSRDSQIYKFLIIIEKEQEQYYHGFSEFFPDQIKMKQSFK